MSNALLTNFLSDPCVHLLLTFLVAVLVIMFTGESVAHLEAKPGSEKASRPETETCETQGVSP